MQVVQSHQILVIGKVGTAFGVQGWVKIHSFTEPATNILDYKPWFLSTKTGFEEMKVQAREQGNALVAQFEGCHDRDQAKAFTHREIGILRTALPEVTEPGEYYWADLEGLVVINQRNVTLGRVDHLFETGANDVMVVKGEKEYLIPFRWQNTVLAVDLLNRCIHVDWDEDF